MSDRSMWPPGPWDHEADRVQWTDAVTGLPCLIRRGPLGAWCGYVAVPPGHPFHGKGYDDCDVDVHGGLTYAGKCFGDEETGICHVPEEGQPHDVWWLGFDCAHCFDVVPGLRQFLDTPVSSDTPLDFPSQFPGDIYRTEEYVTACTLDLAKQLKEAS